MKIIKNLNHFFPTHILGNEKNRIIVYVKNDNPEVFTKIIKLIFKSYSPGFKSRKIITFPINYDSIKKDITKKLGLFVTT